MEFGVGVGGNSVAVAIASRAGVGGPGVFVTVGMVVLVGTGLAVGVGSGLGVSIACASVGGVLLHANRNTPSTMDRAKLIVHRKYMILVADCRQSITIPSRKQGEFCTYICYRGALDQNRSGLYRLCRRSAFLGPITIAVKFIILLCWASFSVVWQNLR